MPELARNPSKRGVSTHNAVPTQPPGKKLHAPPQTQQRERRSSCNSSQTQQQAQLDEPSRASKRQRQQLQLTTETASGSTADSVAESSGTDSATEDSSEDLLELLPDIPVFCGTKNGTFRTKDDTVCCCCDDCDGESMMKASKFEAHAGQAHNKKWKTSLKVHHSGGWCMLENWLKSNPEVVAARKEHKRRQQQQIEASRYAGMSTTEVQQLEAKAQIAKRKNAAKQRRYKAKRAIQQQRDTDSGEYDDEEEEQQFEDSQVQYIDFFSVPPAERTKAWREHRVRNRSGSIVIAVPVTKTTVEKPIPAAITCSSSPPTLPLSQAGIQGDLATNPVRVQQHALQMICKKERIRNRTRGNKKVHASPHADSAVHLMLEYVTAMEGLPTCQQQWVGHQKQLLQKYAGDSQVSYTSVPAQASGVPCHEVRAVCRPQQQQGPASDDEPQQLDVPAAAAAAAAAQDSNTKYRCVYHDDRHNLWRSRLTFPAAVMRLMPLGTTKILHLGSYHSAADAARAADLAAFALFGVHKGLRLNFPLSQYSAAEQQMRSGEDLVVYVIKIRPELELSEAAAAARLGAKRKQQAAHPRPTR